MTEFLVVEDDSVLRASLTRAIERRGYSVKAAADAGEARLLCADFKPQKILLDLMIPGVDGLSLLKELLACAPAADIVILTGYGTISTAVEAVKLGAKNFLTKPSELRQILAAFNGENSEMIKPPSLESVEREHIARVLSDHGGNLSRTAKALGLHRRTLQRKLAKLKLR